jgi:CelD/BcsL family acetyltransferase involved in cellulose biosynthesis
MSIELLAPEALSPADIEAWEALQASNPALASPFLSPHWPLALAAVDGPDAEGLRIAVLREQGRARAFLPLRRRRFTALPAGAPMSDYQGVVAEPGATLDLRAVVRALGVQRLDFSHAIEGQADFAPYVKGGQESLLIDVSNGYEAYAAAQRAHSDILKDTEKKKRKVEREKGEVVFTALSTDWSDFDKLIAWKRAQYRLTGQTDIFAAGWPLRLLENIRADDRRDFGGAFFTLHVGGELAAAHFALRGRDVLHAWFIAHDDAFGKYSPGVILMVELLKWQAQNGYRVLDLGPGDYRFKHQLSNAKLPVGFGFVGRPSAAAFLRGAEYEVRRACEALPLGRMSALPGKAMRRFDTMRALGVGVAASLGLL